MDFLAAAAAMREGQKHKAKPSAKPRTGRQKRTRNESTTSAQNAPKKASVTKKSHVLMTRGRSSSKAAVGRGSSEAPRAFSAGGATLRPSPTPAVNANNHSSASSTSTRAVCAPPSTMAALAQVLRARRTAARAGVERQAAQLERFKAYAQGTTRLVSDLQDCLNLVAQAGGLPPLSNCSSSHTSPYMRANEQPREPNISGVPGGSSGVDNSGYNNNRRTGGRCRMPTPTFTPSVGPEPPSMQTTYAVERAVCAAVNEVAAEATQNSAAAELVGWGELLAEDLSTADNDSDDGMGHDLTAKNDGCSIAVDQRWLKLKKVSYV